PLSGQKSITSPAREPLNRNLLLFLDYLNIESLTQPLLRQEEIEESSFHEISKLVQMVSGLTTVEPEALQLKELIKTPVVNELIGVNYYNNIEWFNGESFQLFSWWVFTLEALKFIGKDVDSVKTDKTFKIIRQWLKNAEKSEYQINRLLTEQREK
ncbi:MAG: hypothetical protein L3J12_09070, partial [Spirochaetales bacterium]|nr:hypothetical protein [Spirochaetales bacterium]